MCTFRSTTSHPLQETVEGCIAESYMFRHVVLRYHVAPCCLFFLLDTFYGNKFSTNKQLLEQSFYKSALSLSVTSMKLVKRPPGTCKCTYLNHLLNTYHSVFCTLNMHRPRFLCGYRKYVSIPSLFVGCSSCLWVSLLRVKRLQHLKDWHIHKSQLNIHESVAQADLYTCIS